MNESRILSLRHPAKSPRFSALRKKLIKITTQGDVEAGPATVTGEMAYNDQMLRTRGRTEQQYDDPRIHTKRNTASSCRVTSCGFAESINRIDSKMALLAAA